MLIWHSDLKVNTRNTLENGTRYAHYEHSVVQKDGLFELENGGPGPPINAGDIYLPGDVFSDTTTPNTKWWSGESSGVEVKDIVLVNDSLVEFTVVIPELHDDHYDPIPKDNWTIVFETPSQAGFDGTKAFDDDVSTYYHVPFGSSDPRPHELVIDLGMEYEITEFYYTANDNFSPPWEGRIKDYELSFSLDGVDWGNPVISEQFFQTPYKQYALFQNEEARYVRFSAFNSYLDDQRTSIAEIDFRGKEATVSSNGEILNYASQINFSPNPVADILNIDGLEEDCIIRIFNSVGIQFGAIEHSNSSLLIDMKEYASGVWMIVVFDKFNRQITSKKVLKLN